MISANDILAYCMEQHGTKVPVNPGETTIVYVEGMNTDFTLNNDAPNRFNDLRMIYVNDANGTPVLRGKWRATTEPGTTSTNSAQADKLGGVARIAFGFWEECWRYGNHKGPDHRALVQCAKIRVHRDFDKNGFRTGEKIVYDVQGLNHHGPSWSFTGDQVNDNSAGCLVGFRRMEHEAFMNFVLSDPRFKALGKKWKVSSTICDGGKLAKWVSSQNQLKIAA